MLPIEHMKEVFKELAWDFGCASLRLSMLDGARFIKKVGGDTLAAVYKGEVFINTDYLQFAVDQGEDPMPPFLGGSVHEYGHPYVAYSAPGSFRNSVADNVAVREMLGAEHCVDVRSLLNIVYDTKIDVLSYDRGLYDPRPLVGLMNRKNGMGPGSRPNYVGQYLMAFREEMMGDRFSGFDIEDEVRETARKVIAIVRDPVLNLKPREQILEISRILVELFNKDGSINDIQSLFEAISKALAELGIQLDSMSAEEAAGDVEAAVGSFDPTKSGEREAARNLLGFEEDEMLFQILWKEAEKAVRFQLELQGAFSGQKMHAGHVKWRPGMPLRDLDAAGTLMKSGVFIPGITTVQPHLADGPGVPVPGAEPRIFGSFDVSGSMCGMSDSLGLVQYELVMIAMFAIIQEARRRKVPVGMNIFGDNNVTFPWTYDYKDLARKIFKTIHKPGGGNCCAGLEPLENLMGSGDLLIYGTDYYLCGSEEAAAGLLQALTSKGIQIAMIAMFDHNGDAAGIPYVECKTLEELGNISLKAINS